MSITEYEIGAFALHIQELAENIEDTTPLRRAFKRHLALVAAACHDIEWVDSYDYGKGDEVPAIEACLSGGAELEQVMADAREFYRVLGDVLK